MKKEVRKLCRQWTKFARKIDNKISVNIINGDWGAYRSLMLIDIPLAEPEQSKKAFEETIKKELEKIGYSFIYNDFEDYVWSFLHECGHLCKPKVYRDAVYRRFADLCGSLGMEKIANKIYFNLKEEKTATAWACKFAVDNYEMLLAEQRKIFYTYQNFFKKCIDKIEQE